MKKEDLQNSQQGSGNSENQRESRDQQKNQATSISSQKANLKAGLGRDRMTDIENLGGISGRDDYAGSDGDDMSNQNTNEPTDR